MKIRSLASPSFVFEADDEAAKQLIESGIYEAVDESETLKIAGIVDFTKDLVRADATTPLETRPAKKLRRTRG